MYTGLRHVLLSIPLRSVGWLPESSGPALRHSRMPRITGLTAEAGYSVAGWKLRKCQKVARSAFFRI